GDCPVLASMQVRATQAAENCRDPHKIAAKAFLTTTCDAKSDLDTRLDRILENF
ncbi:Hypothetical predicted protein, partial [Pelobates cultripes]